jgi:hypothetical protein
MPRLERWIDVRALTREPFLAINAANDTRERFKKNTNLRAEDKTGDWVIPKAAFNVGLKGALVVLFFRHKHRPAEVLTGRILSYRKSGISNRGQDRYRLTIESEWKRVGTFDEAFGRFFDGLKFGSGTACAWMSEPKENSTSSQDDAGEEGGFGIGLAVRRIKHEIFVRNTRAFWGDRCAITRIEDKALLQACHLVPFREANGKEKVDGNNGVVLCNHLHALLDRYLLAFADDGDLLVSSALSDAARTLLLPKRFKGLKVPPNKWISAQRMAYFSRHRIVAEQRAKDGSFTLEPVR